MIFSFFRAEVIIGFNGEHGHGNLYWHLLKTIQKEQY